MSHEIETFAEGLAAFVSAARAPGMPWASASSTPTTCSPPGDPEPATASTVTANWASCLIVGCTPTGHHCGPATTPADRAPVDTDPVLAALAHARSVRDDAHCRLRLLLAYARTFTYPRPYTLAALAHAADMSISGIRTAYHHDDITTITHRLAAAGRPTRASTAGRRTARPS